MNRTKIGSRQARAALLWGLVAFVISQLGLAAAIEWKCPELRDPFYGCKANRLHRRSAGPEAPFTLVMLGSSRTTYGFQASALEPRLSEAAGRPVVAFNFGIPGAGPLMELLTLRRLLAAGVHP